MIPPPAVTTKPPPSVALPPTHHTRTHRHHKAATVGGAPPNHPAPTHDHAASAHPVPHASPIPRPRRERDHRSRLCASPRRPSCRGRAQRRPGYASIPPFPETAAIAAPPAPATASRTPRQQARATPPAAADRRCDDPAARSAPASHPSTPDSSPVGGCHAGTNADAKSTHARTPRHAGVQDARSLDAIALLEIVSRTENLNVLRGE